MMRRKLDDHNLLATCARPSADGPQDVAARGGTKSARGVALILVMLSMLILTMLAATIVFTARAETFASNNYKLDTQADYLAKAGIQRAINWFRSNHYQPVVQTNALTYYHVTSTADAFNLYTSGDPSFAGSPVICKSGCTTNDSLVQLIGYGSGSSNYPGINNTESTPRTVAAAFAADLNNSSPDTSTNRITADSADSGFFNINAKLLNFQTVILSAPSSPLPNSCVTSGTTTWCTVETWMITSKGTWNSSSSATDTRAIAEEVAVVQPIFWPTSGNALYGYCSVDMTGSAGTCTDAFNSSLGSYGLDPITGLPNPSVASGICDSTSVDNVISTGAGVGANGGVSLGSNVTVGGNVTIGSNPTSGCTASGYSGSVDSVKGEVINGPHVTPPSVPTFPSPFPGAAHDVTLTGSSNQTVPDTATWSTAGTWPNWTQSGTPPFTLGATPPATGQSSYYCNSGSCDGSSSKPFMIGTIKMTGSGNLNLVGGTSPLNPVYYDIACISQTGGSINVSGYVVLNVQGTSCSGSTGMDLEGNGISNGIACTAPCTNIPPSAVQINYAGSTKGVKIGGNGAISAVITAPLADVTLGGGGANGYMVGSIQANTISVSGGYPIHYDINLARVGGAMGNMISTAYGRKKM
jgi:Tfp pilus assembly protein PilX